MFNKTIFFLQEQNIPYTEFECGIVIHADTMKVVEHIEEWNHIITDPPYGTTSCEWDKFIDPAELFEKTIRMKDNANLICFGNEPFSTKYRFPNLDIYKYDIVWEKSNITGFIHAKNQPMRKFENIMVFSTGAMGHSNLLGEKRMVYNPQGLKKIPPKTKKTKSTASNVTNSARPSHRDTISEYTNYPNNFIVFAARENEVIHETQKPIELLSYLIETYTNDNDIVLDFFGGSGSTAIACINTKRKFIIIEKHKEFYQLIINRINERLENYLPGF